ncbi:hypothetical protein KFK14_14830 [Sphingobium phenoxybenzoativorans]|uniref:Polyvalent protein metallopeptidase domain-containing protein n=1 Tax=Sphingobium phenoxybenzoativorans TaxID=1592790 RepID=A0A975Q453_9SPHN|nr:hypothetical protein KFK14_14830 [Sphingobium phenoxybenzoativorans]
MSDDRPSFVVLCGIGLLERRQIRLNAGFQIFGHDLRAPCCRSDEDYAEWPARNHAASRANSATCGIIRIAALWVLCRYRHNTHWTGHARRLDRFHGVAAIDPQHWYAREELVAEMAAAFLCAELGIIPTVRHADYIGSWLAILRQDNRAIFRAAAQASKAARYLMAFLIPEDGES